MLVRVVGAVVAAGAGLTVSPISVPMVRAADINTEEAPTEKPAVDTETPRMKSPAAAPVISADKRVLVSQLPLYSGLPEVALVYVPETEDNLRQYMTEVRQVVWKQLETFDSTWSVVKEKYCSAKKYGKDLGKYLQEDAGALPRAAFITVSGLGGIVAGYKGGVFRKTFYASGGMLAAASICYPEQAVDISRRGWVITKDQAKELWQQTTAKTTEEKVTPAPEKTEASPEKKEDSTSENKSSSSSKKSSKDKVKVAESSETSQKSAPKEDHGMSAAEDKAMYSTRTS